MRRMSSLRYWCLVALLALPAAASRGEEGKLRVLLLGDSTTIGSVCRRSDPDGLHLEDVIRLLLAADPGLPPAEVVNQGRDGEYIRGLLASGRYDKEIAPLGGFDYVLIRYGLNDIARREDFEADFPKDYAELIGRLRRDFPRATIVPMTIIPYMTPGRDEAVNGLIRKVAGSERLPLLDVYSRYAAELTRGPDMLNYRRYPLEKIPERHRGWVKPFVRGGQVDLVMGGGGGGNRTRRPLPRPAGLVRRPSPEPRRLSRHRRRDGAVPREAHPGEGAPRGRRRAPAGGASPPASQGRGGRGEDHPLSRPRTTAGSLVGAER